jgi:putative membrane-bound dehydrogenase-like protein
MPRLLSSLALTLALALTASAQVPPDKCLATMKAADGWQVELFAAEPLLINPTSMDVDHKGRVWIAEAVNYRRKNFNRPILRTEGDRIVVLVDKDGDGKADDAVTFYQSPEIYGPIGVCVAPYPDGKGQKVFVCQSPDILVFEDKDGDLKADGPPQKFLTGFGGFDHDHGVHGINIGPDGKLYFTVGDAGVTGLQSSDKKGPVFKSNQTDCRAGTVWRCDMDGTHVELIAHNFRNNYECCVDSFGEVWLSDNDDDGNQQTRICFVMPGGNYGYNPRGPGQTHWHEEQPGIVHKTLRTGFGSPTGITFYEGQLLPPKYRGSLLHCDAGPREVRAFFRKPKGAGYELDKEVILTSTDTWFRPSDVTVAPDGSIFVCDWYDPGVGGHGMGDWTRGRVFRLTPTGHKGYKPPVEKLDMKEGIIESLLSPCQATRAAAIARMRTMTATELLAWIREPGQGGTSRIRDSAKTDTPRVAWQFKRFLESPPKDKDTREAAELLLFALLWGDDGIVDPLWVRILSDAGLFRDQDRFEIKLSTRLTRPEPGPAVAREWLIALRNVPVPQAVDPFYKLAKQYKGNDHFYLAALNIACGTDPARRDAILADFDKHFPEWNDTVADLVWELRPKSVLPRLGKLLADPKLNGPQKARIVDILAASDDLDAGRTMLAVLKSDAAPEVKGRAVESLKLFLPTKWKALQGSKELNEAIDGLLKDRATQIVGLQLVAAVGATDRVEAVLRIADGNGGPVDHADPIQDEAVRTLGKLKTAASVKYLSDEALGATVNPQPTPRVAAAINGLGAMITGQPKDEIGAKAQAALQRLVTERDPAFPRRQLAVEVLAGTRPGTDWLLALKEKGMLPKELDADAGRLLRNSPFQGQRNKALVLFPAPGKLDPKKLPALVELAKRTGDAGRGKQVWDASLAGAAQCAKCHMVRGVGGQVGPDLSMVGKKGSRENLFESVLDPSKAIADQYVQHSVTTTADLTVSGLLVSDTPEAITLRDANGKDTVVPRKEVAGEVRKLKVSIMPQDVVAALSEDELIDLVAYLETLKTAALTPDAFNVVGPFPAKDMATALKTEFGPEKEPYSGKAIFAGKGTGLGWRTIRPDGKGYFDLAAYHGTAGNNSASYLHVDVESPVDQDGEVLLGSDDGAKLWVNGKEVFATEATRAAAPGQDSVKVRLKKGRNAILLKVANGNNPHGAYFSLLTAEETKVAKPVVGGATGIQPGK